MIRRSAAAALIVLSLGALAQSVHAAEYTREMAPWPVVIDGDTVTTPFWGGVNSPKPSLVDFDGDGLTDMMIGDARGKVSYIRNSGTAQVPAWTPIADRIGGIDVGSWHRFCDIDADGDQDLFGDAKNGKTAFFRNVSNAPIVFVEVDTAFGGFVTDFNNTGDFADIDADGDFDFFYGPTSGTLAFYRNDGDSANPSFTWITNEYDSVLAFPTGSKSPAEPLHGFSLVHFADIDADADLDLFYGDIFNVNLFYFGNLGDADSSDLTYITDKYLPISTQAFNHPSFADLDDDSDLDMLIGAANGQDINNLILLRNLGTPQSPLFLAEDLNVFKNIDVGSNAVPAFGDLDGDGDLDMILGAVDGRLRHFENVGDAENPSFNRTSDFYLAIDVGIFSSPALVDWDGDNDLDLLIGTGGGRVEFWRNDGSATVFSPVLADNQLGGIQIDQVATPRPADLDDDGLLDLIVGEWDFNGFANILLYENTGAAGAPALTLVTSRLLKREPRDLTLPLIVDWDEDGADDLVIGGREFGYTLYRNTSPDSTFPDSLTLIAQPDTLPGSELGYYLAMVLADIDYDGDGDIFIGEEDGGVNFYRREGVGCLCPHQGDVAPIPTDGDGGIDVLDVVAEIDMVFRSGPPLADDPLCPYERADVAPLVTAGDGAADILDVVAMIDLVFRSGPLFNDPCDP